MTATAHYHQEFGERHVGDLRRAGLTTCKRPGMYDDAMLVIENVKRLIALDPVEQVQWVGGIIHDSQRDDGLLPPGEHSDPGRWLFHYTRYLPDALARNGVDLRRHHKFLEACERLAVGVEQVLAPAYAELGVGKPQGPIFIRCLIYQKSAQAAPHWDRNAGSVHIAETHAGLLVPEDDDFGPESPRLRLVERTVNDTLHVFNGAKMSWVSEGRLPALWHGADASVPDGEVRGVVVAFHHGNIADDVIPQNAKKMKLRGETARLIREYRQRQRLKDVACAI